jgi:hypothetical protein
MRGAKPPSRRRLLVPSTMTLGDLHLVIQAAMAGETATSIPSISTGDKAPPSLSISPRLRPLRPFLPGMTVVA